MILSTKMSTETVILSTKMSIETVILSTKSFDLQNVITQKLNKNYLIYLNIFDLPYPYGRR